MRAIIDLLSGIAVAIAVICAMLFISYLSTSFKCWSTWSGTEIEWRMSKLSCQVKSPIGWVPQERFRVQE